MALNLAPVSNAAYNRSELWSTANVWHVLTVQLRLPAGPGPHTLCSRPPQVKVTNALSKYVQGSKYTFKVGAVPVPCRAMLCHAV